jgi:endonuclease/exonuclease/phosphatase family metal-dependent hydrolase
MTVWMGLLFFSGTSEPAKPVRFATFNVQELSVKKLSEIDAQGKGTNLQLKRAAAAIQAVRPDVLLLNEIDGPAPNRAENAPKLFLERYLKHSQFGQQPIDFPHVFYEPSNTGEPTGLDMDGDGKTTGPEDAYGFGRYPGEYAMALLSKFPIDHANARTFRKLRWKEMPGNLLPDGEGGRPKFYGPKQIEVFRLSSKSHWDVPIDVNGTTIHILACHPTPPIFDGPEDRNGRRNFDELRLLRDYLAGGEAASYIKDDQGRAGGLDAAAKFVILGDLNADPVRYEAPYGVPPIHMILNHPRVVDPRPTSKGAAEDEASPPLKDFREFKTSHFGRIDYALPSNGLKIVDSKVFWPGTGERHAEWFIDPDPASDHRPVWVDVQLPPSR